MYCLAYSPVLFDPDVLGAGSTMVENGNFRHSFITFLNRRRLRVYLQSIISPSFRETKNSKIFRVRASFLSWSDKQICELVEHIAPGKLFGRPGYLEVV
jgi:hypothetical protein